MWISHKYTSIPSLLTSLPPPTPSHSSWWCGPFFTSSLNLLHYCFSFVFWLFGFQACGILVPQPGIEPTPSALEAEVLTPGPPGKSHQQCHSYQSTFQRLTKMGLLEMADIPERWSKKHCVNCWFSDAPVEDQVASQQLCTLGPGCPGCTQMRLVFSIMVLLSLGEPKRIGWEQNIAVYFFSFSVKQCSF